MNQRPRSLAYLDAHKNPVDGWDARNGLRSSPFVKARKVAHRDVSLIKMGNHVPLLTRVIP